MSICRGLASPRVRLGLLAALFVLSGAELSRANACSCSWRGPFLTVAPDALLVVRGKVLRHHPGARPTMDFQVVELLAGGLLDSGLRVQMGDGMHCRPGPELFPVDSEWVIALNGPGAKPGKGLAISFCGEYWLRVEGNEAVGSIDGKQGETKRLLLSELRQRLRYPRFAVDFQGRIEAGARYSRNFGPGFEFALEPTPAGWEIAVRDSGGQENLARLTPPLHAAPNPREIEGWHLDPSLSTCPRPYGAEAGPENPRQFIFSPAVGRRIDGPDAGRAVTPEEVEEVGRFGRGTLTIHDFALQPGSDGCPRIGWLEFSVHLEGGY
jgi:hypothetical protein